MYDEIIGALRALCRKAEPSVASAFLEIYEMEEATKKIREQIASNKEKEEEIERIKSEIRKESESINKHRNTLTASYCIFGDLILDKESEEYHRLKRQRDVLDKQIAMLNEAVSRNRDRLKEKPVIARSNPSYSRVLEEYVSAQAKFENMRRDIAMKRIEEEATVFSLIDEIEEMKMVCNYLEIECPEFNPSEFIERLYV